MPLHYSLHGMLSLLKALTLKKALPLAMAERPFRAHLIVRRAGDVFGVTAIKTKAFGIHLARNRPRLTSREEKARSSGCTRRTHQ